ncbi:DUF5666 domain-containing protein [Kineosporia sp. NBRC 101677]|uniref:DUF5666 domain-containing protein n=1 Tax=Kineosporia sp. NBRC 101677 TaxID=3032197 RepID=UPI002554F388|nr:DUF5666 domain-containing protein [Kineosporia sp. NBRC 101677]
MKPAHPETDAAATAPAGIDLAAVQPDDLDLLAENGRKVTRLTVFLMAAVLAALAFVGGVVVQKQFGTSGGASAMGGMPSGMAGGMGGSMPGGGYGGGGFGGAAAGGANSQQRTGGGAESASATPVVVGTVTKVSGRTLTVKNFAGKSVTVKVPAGTTVSDSSDSALSGLAKGVSVSVVGEKASDGTVTATSITAS